jgi:N-acetylglucosamine kinase-like BadF-type ATPase
MEVGQAELIGDEASHLILVRLLEAALVKLDGFVLNTLLEGEVGMAFKTHGEDILETIQD